MMLEAWETAKELAAFLKVSVPAIRKWTRQGLPHLKCGRSVRYNREQAIAYLRERQAQKERNHNGTAAEELGGGK